MPYMYEKNFGGQSMDVVRCFGNDEYVVQILFHLWTCLEAGRGNSKRSCFCGGSGSQIMAGASLIVIVTVHFFTCSIKI